MRPIDADKIPYVEAVKDTFEPSGEFYARREDIRAMPTIEPELRWIPCSEKLPEDEYVLISKKPTKISGSKWSVDIAIRTSDPKSRKIQWRDSGFGVIQDDKVLAWMSLPEPWKGERDGDIREKMQIVIDNYFKSECNINTTIKNAFEKGFHIGVKKALSTQQWIPCSDPSDLPKDKRLWITREISDGFFTLREVSDVIWDMTEWSGSVSGVVAYMPYWEPEPYTERREE